MTSFYRGGGSDADDGELTYWEEKYGGGTGSSSSSAFGGGPPPSVLDGSAFLPTYNDTDRGALIPINIESQQKCISKFTEYFVVCLLLSSVV